MSERLIGLEYEFLAVQLSNGQATTRDLMKAIWRDFGKQKNITTYIDYGTKQPVGVEYRQQNGEVVIINTDAGIDVVEFGFIPQRTIAECEHNMRDILKDFLRVANKHGVGLLAYGIQPKTPHYFPDLKSEKMWYRTFLRFPYLAAGHAMYHNIAAHQPCIDVTYDELIPVLNSFNALGGVFIALFANSGVGEWKMQCCDEEREHRWNMWAKPLPKISGIPERPFRNFRDYLTYNWTIPLPAIHRNKTLHVVEGNPSIIEYLRKRSWVTMDVGVGEPSRVSPSIEDVNLSNMYIWIQARPKFFFDESVPLRKLMRAYDAGPEGVDAFAQKHLVKLYIETRDIACQPWPEIMAAPAFLLGLIENIRNVEPLVGSKPWSWWRALREQTIRKSFRVAAAHVIAKKLVDIAAEGLYMRGNGEEQYLAPLHERIAKKASPAQMARKDFQRLGIEKFFHARLIRL